MRRFVFAGLTAAAVFATGVALAATQLVRGSVDAGGGRSTGATYAITATFGQVDASRAMSSTRYLLAGGFWPDLREDNMFRDGFEDP